jgi:hypothetical protein
LSNFPNENLDVCFNMLEEILIFRGQERIEIFGNFFFFFYKYFWKKKIRESEFKTKSIKSL